MKTHQDPRHLKRIATMQELFAWDFSDRNSLSLDTRKIVEKIPELDTKITQSAPAWPIEKINKIDLALLRLSAYELMFEKETPVKVVVDEAVELAKEYGSKSSPGFINGALGKLIADLGIDKV